MNISTHALLYDRPVCPYLIKGIIDIGIFHSRGPMTAHLLSMGRHAQSVYLSHVRTAEYL